MSVNQYPEVAVVFTNKTQSAGSVVALIRSTEYLATRIKDFNKEAQLCGFEVEVIENYFEGAAEENWSPSIKGKAADEFKLEDPFKNAINLLKGFDGSASISDASFKDTFGFANYLETENHSYAEVAGVVMDESLYNCINFKQYASSIGMVTTESMDFNLSELAGHWNVPLTPHH